MAYPVQASQKVPGNGTFTVPFRPAQAGLVTVIVIARGEPSVTGGGNGNGNGRAKQPAAQVFRAFTVAVQLSVFKPGATTPAATDVKFVNVVEPEISSQLVLVVNVPADDADLAADWHAQVTNPPAGFTAAHELVPASCQATVRYQVQPGNLGKVDHIVVTMMENRSFDHMLGFLSLPAPGGRGRSDVDGLTGSEYNRDESNNQCFVKPRQAPKPGLTPSMFLTDPGHGWDQVQQQLGPDSRDPLLTHNAGFVLDFAAQINTDVQNLPPGMATVSDQGTIGQQALRTIAFRPALPGLVTVVSTPTAPPTHSESGSLGSIALRMPGASSDLKNVTTPIGQTALGLQCQVTEAELATAGDWHCTVTNGTNESLTFSTEIRYVDAPHDTSHQELPDAVMSYYTQEQLPVYDHLARHFAICDRWYASIPTDTWPNRLYALTGGCGGLLETPSDASVEHGPPGFLLRTIFEVLNEQQVEWNIFFTDLPFALIFTRLAQDAAYTSQMRTIDEFVSRAATGDLPSFCWLDPNFQDVPDNPVNASDDHPPGDVSHGQAFISRIYNALASGPAWAKTLLIITYDEHGGFYDHVLPPSDDYFSTAPPVAAAATEPAGPVRVAPAHAGSEPAGPVRQPSGNGPPDDDQFLHRYGLRVPAIVVSPWVAPESVSHDVHDHTSLLSTALRRFCQADDGTVPSMGARADNALPVGAMLAADTPVLDPPLAPAVAPGPGLPVVAAADNTFADVLRMSLFRF
jgi:phospholipase C